MDVLILTVSFGGGHTKAAEAIKESILEKNPSSRILIVDAYKYVSPFVDKLIVGGYLGTLKKTPKVYGKLYDMSESGENFGGFSRQINKLLSFRIKTLINEFRPSIIVCTQAFPLQIMSILKRKQQVLLPTIGVLTDYVSHPLWLHEYIDAYVVPHDFMKYELILRNIPEKIIYPLGIPISKSFKTKNDKNRLIEEFGLENKLTFLIMGGSLGFGELKSAFDTLLNIQKDLQVIVVTGNNTKLKRQLENRAYYSKKKVLIFGYTERVAELMDVSDFIITKPGGMTITESIIKELPIFIISPIPGQEERNTQFLLNGGVAARLEWKENMESFLLQVVDNPLRVTQMKEMTRYLAKPNASQDIVNLMENILENYIYKSNEIYVE